MSNDNAAYTDAENTPQESFISMVHNIVAFTFLLLL